MADTNKDKAKRLLRRKYSIRNGGLFGTPERPRLSVFRSSKHIYAQLIDDMAGKTLVYVGSSAAEVRGAEVSRLDRGPHGAVEAADALLEEGLELLRPFLSFLHRRLLLAHWVRRGAPCVKAMW